MRVYTAVLILAIIFIGCIGYWDFRQREVRYKEVKQLKEEIIKKDLIIIDLLNLKLPPDRP